MLHPYELAPILLLPSCFTEKENDKQIYGIFLRLNGRGNLSIQSFSAVIVLFPVYQKNSDNGHIHLKYHQAYAYK